MAEHLEFAPGWPGNPARWTSSAKTGIGTARNRASRVWFSLSHGILNEIYYPRVDQACVRDLGMIVTDGKDYFSEEKRHTSHQVSYLADGVPAYRLVNTCTDGHYRIEKEILSDPVRDALLQRTRFVPLKGTLADYHLYTLLAPHINNRGAGNSAWVGDYKGVPMLFAFREGNALALAATAPWLLRSAGFVGHSDGWQDLVRHKQLTQVYAKAENGNVALTGEIDLAACGGEFILAVGFGRDGPDAGNRARASLLSGFDAALAEYVSAWKDWQDTLLPLDREQPTKRDLYRISAVTLRIHEEKRYRGGIIASLSIPWGFDKGDDDIGGYHLVWPRDLVEIAGGFLAAGQLDDARYVLQYLHVTQEADGHWPQNMWQNGDPYWHGVQTDETALPILLVDLCRREGALKAGDVERFWPMVRKAAGFLCRNGPVTQQDRWEEDAGYTPFSAATAIAALLVAAEMAEEFDEPELGNYFRETADAGNSALDKVLYVTGTDLAKKVGVEGYYIRIAPPDILEQDSPFRSLVPVKNLPPEEMATPADHLVSPDALALVRFGLRAADDPRVVNTVKVIDALLKTETPFGPCWHRYNKDGYGEHPDGTPFNGTGIGRAWPLLTGERAHFELQAGRRAEAERLLAAMEAFASDGGMIPEQVWDAPDFPDHELFFGRPSGSAMPLVWAHGEYIKLRRSLRDGRVFDLPPQTAKRYLVQKVESPRFIWRFDHKVRFIPRGQILRVGLLAPAVVHWTSDGWRTVQDTPTWDSTIGMHRADLDTQSLPSGTAIDFTFHWNGADRWEGKDFRVVVAAG